MADEFIERLRAVGGALKDFTPSPQTNDCLIIDSEQAKLVLQQMLREAGVDLRYHALCCDVIVADSASPGGSALTHVVLETKSGRQAVAGRFFIDASGDGDVAARSGAPFQLGSSNSAYPQSATLTFRVDGVDEIAFRSAILTQPELFDMWEPCYRAVRRELKNCIVGGANLIAYARSQGLQVPFARMLTCSLIPEGAMLVNMTHVEHVRCHEAADLSRAEL